MPYIYPTPNMNMALPKHTLHMLNVYHKGYVMSIWENVNIQQLKHLQLLIVESSLQQLNPLYTPVYIPRQLATRDGSQSAQPHNTGMFPSHIAFHGLVPHALGLYGYALLYILPVPHVTFCN
jgi:hypothetical protein